MEFRYFRDLVYTDFLASILLELGFGGGTLFRFDTGQKGGSIILAISLMVHLWLLFLSLGFLQKKVPISSGLTIFRSIFYFCHGNMRYMG